MKQLYYTSCREGFSYNGRDGFNIRALSPGFGASERDESVAMAYYQPPMQGMAATSAPVRLAWVKGADANLYLVHAVYVGADPSTRRPGVGFAHLIVSDETAPITLREAIGTWDSPEWMRADGDYSSELPDLAGLPRATGELTLQALCARCCKGRARELLLWTVDAWLNMEAQSSGFDRLIVEGAAQDLAWMVFALAHLLPSQFTADLTFSTYEYAPASSKTRMVGAYVSESCTAAPDTNFASGLLCFNVASGRHSPVPESVFRRPLAAALDAGDLVPLQEMARIMEADLQGHPNPGTFFGSYWAVHGGGGLNSTTFMVLAGARNPVLKEVLAQDSTAEFLAQALQNTAAPPVIPSGFVASLPPQVQEELRQRLQHAFCSAVAEDRLDLASHLLQVIPAHIQELSNTSLLEKLAPLRSTASVAARWLVYSQFKALSEEKQAMDWLAFAPLSQLETLTGTSSTLSLVEKARLIWCLHSQAAADILAMQPGLLPTIFLIASAPPSPGINDDNKVRRLTELLKACAAAGMDTGDLASLTTDPELRKVQLEVLAQVQPAFGKWVLPQLTESDLSNLSPRLLEHILRSFYSEGTFKERRKHESQSDRLRKFLSSKGVDVPDPFMAIMKPLHQLAWNTENFIETVRDALKNMEDARVDPASIQIEVGRALARCHFASREACILLSKFQQMQEAKLVAVPASPCLCHGMLEVFVSWEDRKKWQAIDHLIHLLILVFKQLAPAKNTVEPLIIRFFQELKATRSVSSQYKRELHSMLDWNLVSAPEKKILKLHRSLAFPSLFTRLYQRFFNKQPCCPQPRSLSIHGH